jgi:hypothetical protein
MEQTDVYRVFYPETSQCIFFSAGHGTFSKIHHILGHKGSFTKYKKMEIIPCILSDTCNTTRTQQQKKQLKIGKQLEAKQHTAQ